MKNNEQLKLVNVLVQRSKSENKHFSFDLSLCDAYINGLGEKLTLNLTDHNITRYMLGYSVVIGEIVENDDIIVFGVRTSNDSFAVDLIDLKKNAIYNLYIIDDFVTIAGVHKLIGNKKSGDRSYEMLNSMLRKINKKEVKGINEDLIESFESKIAGKKYEQENFTAFFKDVFTSKEKINAIISCMVEELSEMEAKVYVNTIHNYFIKNPELDIQDYCSDKKIARELDRIRNKPIAMTYRLFTDFPSYVYSIFDKIKENYKKSCVFAEFEDMTSFLV